MDTQLIYQKSLSTVKFNHNRMEGKQYFSEQRHSAKKLLAKVVSIVFILVSIINYSAYSQQTSKNNYTGSWTTSTSWTPTWVTPITAGIAQNITIYGYISYTGDISFGGAGGDLIVNDTLVIVGNLTLGNNNNITVNNSGVLIVRGNLTLANKVDIAANAYIVVTGDFTKTGAAGQGSFTSNDAPSKVFIGGTIDVPGGWASTGPTDVLNCDLLPEYTSSTCNYGNSTDLLVDPINDFVQTTCAAFPLITTQPTNRVICAGSNTSFTVAATGATYYQWQVNSGSGFVNITNTGVYTTARTATLNITAAPLSMNGYIYRCVVRNSGGCATNSNSVTLTVSSTSPSAPTSNAGSGAACSQITANWSASATAIGYYLDVSTVNTFASFVAGYNSLNVSNVTTYNVTGLSSGTTYYYRVRAYNSCGSSGNSGTITYATSPATPAAPGAITGAANQCPGATGQTYSISAVTNATTYTWSVPAGWSITAGAGTTSITVTTGAAGQNGNITVTSGNSCGTSALSSLAVTINTLPVAVDGVTSTCTGNIGDVFSVTNEAGWTYTWAIQDNVGIIPAPGNTSSISVNWKSNADIFTGIVTSVVKNVTATVSLGGCSVDIVWPVTIHRVPETGPQYHIPNGFAQ